ncbi:MAG: response regulator [Deltaproteobacteria bacterium]|nr:response regulator [Deltaproteobacteria bacterium]
MRGVKLSDRERVCSMAYLALKKNLLVDDDKDVVKSLSRYLKRRGYHVSTAMSGKEALKLMEVETPDLVLLDALMPEMDGIETLEQIRERFPKADVVMISALKEEVVAREAIKMGAKEWLPKPFSLEQLESNILLQFLYHKAQDQTEKSLD